MMHTLSTLAEQATDRMDSSATLLDSMRHVQFVRGDTRREALRLAAMNSILEQSSHQAHPLLVDLRHFLTMTCLAVSVNPTHVTGMLW